MRLIRQADGRWAILELTDLDLARLQLGLVVTGQPPLSSKREPHRV
jgi:hypothetical protein